jgi:nicotinate-nucleotide adenylyltransferase
MRIGIMGGTFDPIHIGHVCAAERAMEEVGLDRVWFVPAGAPVGKQPVATPMQRAHMVHISIAHRRFWWTCVDECVRSGTSYAIDSLERWRVQYPGVCWFWIVGADVRWDTWHRIDALTRMCTFVVVDRTGPNCPIPNGACVVNMPPIDVCSSDIRARYAADESVRGMVHDVVDDYVRSVALYGAVEGSAR